MREYWAFPLLLFFHSNLCLSQKPETTPSNTLCDFLNTNINQSQSFFDRFDAKVWP
jgi:hypothetical protein